MPLRRLFIALALIAALSPPTYAAVQDGSELPDNGRLDWHANASTITRIQKALAQARLYSGPQDGRVTPELISAIKAYQRTASLPETGKITPDLADKLEMWLRVEQLRLQLDQTSREHKEAARQALLSNPETRGLLDTKTLQPADPTRDSSPCFDSPTIVCLLEEASQSARAVAKVEMRDWAFNELLVAQAEAGMSDAALDTAKSLSDPRLILVALRDIAEAHARAGRTEEALRAAGLVPDAARRREAFAAIAAILAARGETNAARDAAEELRTALNSLPENAEKVSVFAQLASILYLTEDRAEGTVYLDKALFLADSLGAGREGARRTVAVALAGMGRAEEAVDMAVELKLESDRTSVYVAAVKAYVQAGKAQEALKAARAITEERYRAVALAQAIPALDKELAGQVVSEAITAAEATKSPFARAFGFSRVASAQAEVHLDGALKTVEKIDNEHLKASTLWAIALKLRKQGRIGDARRVETRAKEAGASIAAALTQVWVFSDLALEHHRLGETEQAEDAFAKARDAARTIADPWQRSRALARLGGILIKLED